MCGAPWAESRDIPDVAAWRDLVDAPDEVHRRLSRRIEDDRCPTVSPTVTLPKNGSDELRSLVWMDPFDELWMRILVGRTVAAVDRRLDDSAEVFSYRLSSTYRGWRLEKHQNAHRARRARGEELLNRAGCVGVGTLDIRQYYPSVDTASLANAFASTSAAPGAVELVCDFIDRLPKLGMPAGLPIGAEASGVLGNLMLVHVDAELKPLVQAHIRYTDDSWVFLDRGTQWPDLLRVYEQQTARIGLVPNMLKSAFHEKEGRTAEDALFSGRADSMLAAGGGIVRAEEAREEIENQLEDDETDWTAIRFSLGALMREPSPAGLQMIYSNPLLFQEAPRKTADYLMVLCNQGYGAKVDRDWLVATATDPPTGRSMASKVHACRVLKRLGVGKNHGKSLENLALSESRPMNVPLRAWGAAAWGESEAHKPGLAIDYASSAGELPVRRAFALTVKTHHSSDQRRRKWASHLVQREPDLSPTVRQFDPN